MRRLFGLGAMAAMAMLFPAAPAQADPEYERCIDNARESGFGACGAAWEEREDRRLCRADILVARTAQLRDIKSRMDAQDE